MACRDRRPVESRIRLPVIVKTTTVETAATVESTTTVNAASTSVAVEFTSGVVSIAAN